MRGLIGVGIEPLVWMPIAREEAFEPQNIPICRSPDNHWSANTLLKKTYSSQKQCAHDPLTEIRLLQQDSAERLGRQDERFNRPLGLCLYQRRVA
jgi:hypothetical protein